MMRSKRKLVFCFLAIVLVAGAAWLLSIPREPSYQGKSLTQWLDEYDQTFIRTGSFEKAGPISDAIRAMGTNSLPFLLEYITHTNTPLRIKLQNLLHKQNLIKPSILDSTDRHGSSIFALSALGSNAAPLFPDLLQFVESDNLENRSHGILLLYAIGPSAIPTLEKACKSTNVYERVDAICKIAALKMIPEPKIIWGYTSDHRHALPIGIPGSADCVDQMISLLAYHQNPAVRRASADFFNVSVDLTYAFPNKIISVIPVLIKALNDADPEVRQSAVYALHAFGIRPRMSEEVTDSLKAAIPALTKVLNDPDPDVRDAAADALKALDPDAAAKAGVK